MEAPHTFARTCVRWNNILAARELAFQAFKNGALLQLERDLGAKFGGGAPVVMRRMAVGKERARGTVVEMRKPVFYLSVMEGKTRVKVEIPGYDASVPAHGASASGAPSSFGLGGMHGGISFAGDLGGAAWGLPQAQAFFHGGHGSTNLRHGHAPWAQMQRFTEREVEVSTIKIQAIIAKNEKMTMREEMEFLEKCAQVEGAIRKSVGDAKGVLTGGEEEKGFRYDFRGDENVVNVLGTRVWTVPERVVKIGAWYGD
ncbi:hypothetical protein MKZ38_000525 [Zalerion maritima]|uniref:Uncharacterized protein n=1 Tax=Zalerion maritima TaxID=339359 RepID=A0AAD5RRF1_9PEZI|nr:hypothetical protein MKZ38_000525 [Zalerion maritima]